MFKFGVGLMVAGAALALFSLFGDTSIEAPLVYGSVSRASPDRIHNLGLLARQTAMAQIGAGLIVAGAIFAAAASAAQSIAERVSAIENFVHDIRKQDLLKATTANPNINRKVEPGQRTGVPPTIHVSPEWAALSSKANSIGWTVERALNEIRLTNNLNGVIRTFPTIEEASSYVRASAPNKGPAASL